MTINYEIGKQRQDGRMRITLLVCIGNTKKRIKTEIFATPTDINRKGGLKNDSMVLAKIQERVMILRKEYAKQETYISGEKMSAATFVERMVHSDVPTFFTYAGTWMERAAMKGKKNYKTALVKFRAFLKGSDISFSAFSHKLLDDFRHYLRDLPRAQSQYLGAIKKIYTDAERDYDIPAFATFHFDVPKQLKVGQRAVDLDLLRMIIDYEGTGVRTILARDCYVLSFALCGMNSADLYAAPVIKGGIVSYDRQKTKDRRHDNAHIEIKIPKQIKELVQKYADTSRAFSFHNRFSSASTFNTAINKGLKAIHDDLEKKTKKSIPRLTFYSARHTWATIARNDLGIDKYTIHECLCHIDRDTAIDDLYIKKDFRLINEANKKVVDYVFGS